MPKRVVVTGYGAVSPLGNTVEETWQKLITGISGIDYIQSPDVASFPIKIAGQAKEFDPLKHMSARTAKRADRFAQLAIAATAEAITKAALKINDSNRYETGVLVGSGFGGVDTMEKQFATIASRGHRRASPLLIPMMIADSASAQVSIETGTGGINLSLASSCSTGADAIGLAYKMIKHGELMIAIAGGSDAAITPLVVSGFAQAGALTRRDDPKTASRPFDLNRDGFVISEGAGVVLIEELGHALKRSAPILAEIGGYGTSSDAFHITQPHTSVEPAAIAVKKALEEALLEEVSYISAHGTSTKLNDASETRVIKHVFGDRAYHIPISSIKSMVGHMMGAAGALEVIACCKTIEDGIIPPTINLRNPDPECDLDYVPNKAREARIDSTLSNSFGFGGHNSAIILKRFQGQV
ncbi:MAG: beta-ketoacyl-ACP synthase II [Dehalococcoidales bacterium]|nr:beta-ketoacyl-ACP synthase II [Dehalococcoidales bacterium]